MIDFTLLLPRLLQYVKNDRYDYSGNLDLTKLYEIVDKTIEKPLDDNLQLKG